MRCRASLYAIPLTLNEQQREHETDDKRQQHKPSAVSNALAPIVLAPFSGNYGVDGHYRLRSVSVHPLVWQCATDSQMPRLRCF